MHINTLMVKSFIYFFVFFFSCRILDFFKNKFQKNFLFLFSFDSALFLSLSFGFIFCLRQFLGFACLNEVFFPFPHPKYRFFDQTETPTKRPNRLHVTKQHNFSRVKKLIAHGELIKDLRYLLNQIYKISLGLKITMSLN